MPYQLLKPVDRERLPPLRWQRGLIVDVDPEHLPALMALTPVEEVSREEAAEVIVDKPKKGEKAEKVKDERAEEPPLG